MQLALWEPKETIERIRFCPDEPLCVEEAGFSVALGTSPFFPLPTPSPSPQHPGIAGGLQPRSFQPSWGGIGVESTEIPEIPGPKVVRIAVRA